MATLTIHNPIMTPNPFVEKATEALQDSFSQSVPRCPLRLRWQRGAD